MAIGKIKSIPITCMTIDRRSWNILVRECYKTIEKRRKKYVIVGIHFRYEKNAFFLSLSFSLTFERSGQNNKTCQNLSYLIMLVAKQQRMRLAQTVCFVFRRTITLLSISRVSWSFPDDHPYQKAGPVLVQWVGGSDGLFPISFTQFSRLMCRFTRPVNCCLYALLRCPQQSPRYLCTGPYFGAGG